MKILYCIHSTYNSGGMERILAEKSNYLSEVYGHNVSIVTTEQHGRTNYFHFSTKISFYHLDINYDGETYQGPIQKIMKRIFKVVRHKKALEELLYREKFDVVISMFEREVSFLYKIKDGSKKLLELHFSRFVRIQRNPKGFSKIISYILSYMDTFYAKQYDKFVVLTNEDRGYWKKCNNIITIPNPSINYNFAKSSLIDKQVTAIGRFDYQKGFDSLIRAWKIVSKQSPEWSLHIYGSGPEEHNLLRLILEYDLSSSVHLNKPTDKIGQVYKNTSILVSSSRYEGFPLVMLEAISCGIPIVSYEYACGPKDLIDNYQNGILVPCGDEEKLAEAIMELINGVALRQKMGSQAILKSQQYCLKTIMSKWQELLLSL